MGYYTNYYLDVHEGDLSIQEILESVSENEFEGLNYGIDTDGSSLDSVKWYDHEADMRDLSLKFPTIVFKLHGEGEDNNDIWYKYFKNGKSQDCYAKIAFDCYDETQLR